MERATTAAMQPQIVQLMNYVFIGKAVKVIVQKKEVAV